jgi:predicted RNase H-like HicB family nuclease
MKATEISNSWGEVQVGRKGCIMNDYYINIYNSRANAGYILDIPDLESRSVIGTTAEETLHEVQIAKKAWLEAARAERKLVPIPKDRFSIYSLAEEDLEHFHAIASNDRKR